MLKRKFWLVLVMLVAMIGIWSPKNAYAGTCECAANGGTRMWYIGTNNCGSDEYASGCNGSLSDPNATCSCIKKATTGSAVNTCKCNGSGTITENNCQGGTSVPYCNTRGSVICACSGSGTAETIGRTAVDASAKASNANNPFNGCSTTSINTALGCIPIKMDAFIPWLLSWFFGVAGGIAFLLMAYGFILIATSSGDEKKVQGAKETITSAIIGLVVCIFSIFILRLIAVNILQIPGMN